MLKATSSIVNVSQITGVLPVVNGGTGVTTSTGTGSTVLSAAPTLSGNVTLSTGNLIVASGQGIDFSATPGTGTSELFSDYEEGTWTGTVTTDGTPPVTSNTATGYYTRIGRQVTVRFVRNSFDIRGSTGNLVVSGLPFASRNATGNTAVGSVVFFNVNLPAGTVTVTPVLTADSSSVLFFASVDDANYALVADNLTDGGRVWFTLTYDV